MIKLIAENKNEIAHESGPFDAAGVMRYRVVAFESARLFSNGCRSPIHCPRIPFEGAYDVAGDPAAIKAAGLRFDLFFVNVTGVNAAGVERDMIADGFELRCWQRITPRRILADRLADSNADRFRVTVSKSMRT